MSHAPVAMATSDVTFEILCYDRDSNWLSLWGTRWGQKPVVMIWSVVGMSWGWRNGWESSKQYHM